MAVSCPAGVVGMVEPLTELGSWSASSSVVLDVPADGRCSSAKRFLSLLSTAWITSANVVLSDLSLRHESCTFVSWGLDFKDTVIDVVV